MLDEAIKFVFQEEPGARGMVLHKAPAEGGIIEEKIFVETCKHGTMRMYTPSKQLMVKKNMNDLETSFASSSAFTMEYLKQFLGNRLASSWMGLEPKATLFYKGKRVDFDVIHSQKESELNVFGVQLTILMDTLQELDVPKVSLEAEGIIVNYSVRDIKSDEFIDVRYCMPQVIVAGDVDPGELGLAHGLKFEKLE